MLRLHILPCCRCYEAVSEHPSRQWCLKQSHKDVFKTPVHQAALRGSFRTLSMFLRHSPTCIAAKDGSGVMASTYAMRFHHLECWKLLTVACFRFQNRYGFSLTMVYNILKWCDKAKEKAMFMRAERRRKGSVARFSALGKCTLAGPIVISGFHDKLENKRTETRTMRNSQGYELISSKLRPHSLPCRTAKSVKICDNISKSAMSECKHSSTEKLSHKNVVSCSQPTRKSGVSYSQPTRRSGVSYFKSSPVTSLYRTSSASTHLQARQEARRIIYQKTGKTPTEIASRCFEVGQTFENMKWAAQMKLALKCSLNCIENERRLK